MTYEEYLNLRERLQEENAYLTGNVLNDNEIKLDEKLQQMKIKLSEEMTEENLYKMNCLGDERLWSSPLYHFVQRIPKGSDLHVHATSLLPAWRLIDFVISRPELLVDIETYRIYHKDEAEYPKDRCFSMQEILDKNLLSREDINIHWTLLCRKHNQDVWEVFENLFVLFDSIEYGEDTLIAYNIYSFEYYLSQGITHIEIHALFSDCYERTVQLANIVKKAYFEVKKKNPAFSVSIICAGLKYLGVDKEVPEMYLKNALKLREEVVDDFDPNHIHPFIIGFDLLNEENKSIPLKEFAPMFLSLKETNPDFRLFIHCGESLFAQSDNLIDGYLLDACRVGHGMNLYRFPNLLEKYREKEICLEACPISNKTLRYVKDLRLHPVAEYLKRGVTVALCSDDPVCQEHETLVDDFFAGIVCWDLNLSDIKQLAINSILYSGMDKEQKRELIASWRQDWNRFVQSELLNLCQLE